MTYKPKYFSSFDDIEDDSLQVIDGGISYTPSNTENLFYYEDKLESEPSETYEDQLLNILRNYRQNNQDITGYVPRYDEMEESDPDSEPVIPQGIDYQSSIEDFGTTPPKFNSKKEFIQFMLPRYQKLLAEKGYDPAFAYSLVAQDGIESGWGKEPSGKNNYGGIKGKGTIRSTREYLNGRWVRVNDSFADYNTVEDYMNAKIKLLSNKRYDVFSHPVSEFAYRVKRGGYATAPDYAEGLNSVIASLKKLISTFKSGGKYKGIKKYKGIGYLPVSSTYLIDAETSDSTTDKLSREELFSLLRNFDEPILPEEDLEDLETSDTEEEVPEKEETDENPTTIKRQTYTPKPGFEKLYQPFQNIYLQSGAPVEEMDFWTRKAQDESAFRYNIVGRFVNPKTQKETTGWGYFQQLDTYEGEPMPVARQYSGVDQQTYLNNPIIQIQAAQRMKNDILRQFTQKDWEVARAKGYTTSAMVAGAWAGGVNGVRKWLHRNYNAVDMHFKDDPDNKRAWECSVAGQMELLNGYFKKGGVLKFYTGGTSPGSTLLPETREWLRDLNGKSKYEVNQGKSFVKFYDRLRTGSSESLQRGSFDLVLDEHDGKPIVYSTIIADPNGKLIDLKEKGLDPRQMAIDSKNYIVAPSTDVAQNFIDNYQNMGYWYPDYKSTDVPQTNPKSSSPMRTEVVAVPSINPTLPYIYKTNIKLDLNQVADDGTKYDVIVSNRIKMASDALRRAGFTNQSDIDRLAYFLAAQSIRETGWVDKDPRNNYGGYLLNGKKLTYASAEDFWNKHINNLNRKYVGWDSANNITEYLNILNDPKWYLLTEDEIKAEQAKREKNGEFLWLYAPKYANKGKDYTQEVMDIIDRFTFYYLN